MCLLDTTDGALMMTLYTTTALASDTIAILYYSIVLTGVTVLVAICIGTIQLLSFVDSVAEPEGAFWDGLDVVGDNYDIIGGSICGAFVLAGVVSLLVYKPWRRWAEKGRPHRSNDTEVDGDVDADVEDLKKGKLLQTSDEVVDVEDLEKGQPLQASDEISPKNAVVSVTETKELETKKGDL